MGDEGAQGDLAVAFDEIRRLVADGDVVAARRQLSQVGIELEDALRHNRFDAPNWENLALCKAELDEFRGAADAYKILETRSGYDPIRYFQSIKVRSKLDDKAELERELWQRLQKVPRTREILKAAVSAYSVVGTRFYMKTFAGRDKSFEDARWNGRFTWLEDQLIKSAPNDFHAAADAAYRAGQRLRQSNNVFSAWSARRRAQFLGNKARAILLRQSVANPLAWLYVSEIEEGLGLFRQGYESGLTAFRQAPANMKCLTWVVKRYDTLKGVLKPEDIDSAFGAALAFAGNKITDLLAVIELLIDCDRRALASQILERCRSQDPSNAKVVAMQQKLTLLSIVIEKLCSGRHV